jgi:hypothetical protein
MPFSRKGGKRMHIKGVVTSVVLFMVMGLLIAGCAAGNYGKMREEESARMKLDTLLLDWQNHNIYYGGTNPDRPIAVLFDPKSDGKNLEVEGRWWSVSDEKTMLNAVGRINMLPGAIPRLWRVLGPDDSLYGYVYTPLMKLDITVVNEKTMRVMTR